MATQFNENIENYSVKEVRKLIQKISVPKAEISPDIKSVFNEDQRYSFDEIQKTFLINPFNTTESYSSEEIGQILSDFFKR